MINIEDAIIESKSKPNISDGGSMCFDFGDVVLVKYSCPTKYLKSGEHTREKSEEIMEAINIKADKGVNTPRHYAVKRIVEGENDVCYVLQQKCPGFNCESKRKQGVTFEQMYKELNNILNIPFEHYKKLITDGFQLFEMGYEAKYKNLFYDVSSGFWYIDFLDNEKDYIFDENNIKQVFEALNFRIPKIYQMASSMNFNSKLTSEEQQKRDLLVYQIKAKTLLAIRSVLPTFQKYEKFFLADETEGFKNYLMQEGLVKTDLMVLEEDDYSTFDELYEIVMSGLIDKVVNKGFSFWNIEVNEIRNDTSLFKLQKVWKIHNENEVQPRNFEDDYDYEYTISKNLYNKILLDLVERLQKLEQNQNVEKFLAEALRELQKTNKKMVESSI